MPRKFFRRLLPDHDVIRDNRYVARLSPWLHHPNLWHLNRRSVAGGVAVGLITGLVPGSNPVQFTAAALVAIAGRVNLPVAVLVTLYTNPFTVLPLYYCAFRLGLFVLRQDTGTLPDLPLGPGDRGLGEWLSALIDWLGTVGKPLALGLPLLALAFGVVGYFAMDWTWRLYVRCAWAARRRRKSA